MKGSGAAGKPVLRWRDGVRLGVCSDSGEVCVTTESGDPHPRPVRQMGAVATLKQADLSQRAGQSVEYVEACGPFTAAHFPLAGS